MKARHVVLGVCLAGALWIAICGDRTPAGSPMTAHPLSERPAPALASLLPPATRAERPAAAQTGAARDVPDLIPRAVLIGRDGARGAALGTRSTLFAILSTAPASAPQDVAPPVPTVPPLPFTYIGKQVQDAKWQVFLQREGGHALVVKEGDEVDGIYRIESIQPPSMTLVYLPLKQTQTLAVE